MPGAPHSDDARPMHRYVDQLRRWRWPPSGPLDDDADHQLYRGWRRAVVTAVPERAITPARVAVTRARMGLGTGRRLRNAARPLRLHLACGERRIDGWLNVDLAGSQADIVWDLRRPLPIDDGTVSAIFHEHFLEHLPLDVALAAIGRWHALLEPGGVLRIGVPDMRPYLRSYVEGDEYIESLRPGRPTPLLAIAENVYSYGHRSLWDSDTLRLALIEVGFTDVTEVAFGESVLGTAPDSVEREPETLYVEAIKPTRPAAPDA